jgi:hypothetical protein
MKKLTYCLIAITTITVAAVFACTSDNTNNTSSLKSQVGIKEDSLVARGAYLVTIMGCNDCHTPKKMGPRGPELDEEKLLSGHPASLQLEKIRSEDLKSWVMFNVTQTATAGPWGVSFAANLTSHESGIGNWSEDQFFTAIREGKYKGLKSGRPILPPMPWPMYAQATDDDLRAIFRYLKSTRPVENVVPPPIGPDQLNAMK